MGIYERIKEIASTKEYSINRIEKELGFPRSSICKYNKNVPSMEKVQKIADLLNVSVAELVGESSDQYYTNPETAEMAQTLFENRDLRVLFDAAKDATPEDLKTTYDMLMALKKKERGNDDI